jgi:serine/threonine-protein phosphatase 2A activator
MTKLAKYVYVCERLGISADLAKRLRSLHLLIPNLPEDAIQEVSVYFLESWGNRTRIDYGSGMELNFLCWMCV